MTKSVQLNFDKPVIGPVDAMILKTVAENLETIDLELAEPLCERIAGVYAKNIGYLLFSLESLTRFDFHNSKAFLDRVNVTPPNIFDPANTAKTSLERIIRTVENHLCQGYPNLMFPSLTRELIQQEFRFQPTFFQETLARSMVRMNDKNAERPYPTGNTFETAALQSPIAVPAVAATCPPDADDDLYQS